MDKEKLLLKHDQNLGFFIEEFLPHKVVLNNYFVTSGSNFFKENDLYTDEELGIILNLTDKEYADLVHQYLNYGDDVKINAEFSANQQKISDLEAKLNRSREYEDAKSRLVLLESEFDDLSKQLESVKDIQKKYEDVLVEYNKLSGLKKYNLNKIHEDLVSITNEMDSLEQKIFEHKVENIKSSKNVEYNKGKIVLALSIILASGILGIILLNLEAMFGISLWAFGLVISFLLLFTSKNVTNDTISHNPDLDIYKSRFEELKSDKNKILNLLNLKTTEDFFNVKAKFSSYAKSLEYFSNQRDLLLNGGNYSELSSRFESVSLEMEGLSRKLSDESHLLRPEEYLSSRRELDYLKLSSSQFKANNSLTQEQIIEKLKKIKSELKEKLPEFCSVLKQTYVNSYEQINTNIKYYTNRLNLQYSEVSKDGEGFDELSILQKNILEYSLFKQIYSNNFVFGILPNDSLKSEEQLLQSQFMELIQKEECKFYVFYK